MEDEMVTWWVLVSIYAYVSPDGAYFSEGKAIEKFKNKTECESMVTTLNHQREDGDGKLYVCIPYKRKVNP